MCLGHRPHPRPRLGERGDRCGDRDTPVPGDLRRHPADPLHVALARGRVEAQLRGEMLAHLVAVEERHAAGPAVGEVLGEGPRDRGLAGPGQAREQDDGATTRGLDARPEHLDRGRLGVHVAHGRLADARERRDAVSLGRAAHPGQAHGPRARRRREGPPGGQRRRVRASSAGHGTTTVTTPVPGRIAAQRLGQGEGRPGDARPAHRARRTRAPRHRDGNQHGPRARVVHGGGRMIEIRPRRHVVDHQAQDRAAASRGRQALARWRRA